MFSLDFCSVKSALKEDAVADCKLCGAVMDDGDAEVMHLWTQHFRYAMSNFSCRCGAFVYGGYGEKEAAILRHLEAEGGEVAHWIAIELGGLDVA